MIMLSGLGMLARVHIAPYVDAAILLIIVAEVVYIILDWRLADVIILDLMMPNLDGFTFMTTLSQHDVARLKRIVIISAASPTLISERMRGTPFDLLPKPFDIHDLVGRVRACIMAQA